MKRIVVSLFTAAALLSGFAAQDAVAATTPYYVANPTFKTNTSGWSAGSGDKITRVKTSAGVTSGKLSPKSSKGTKTLSMKSTVGTKTTGPVGTKVHSAVRFRTSQKGAPVYYRMYEYNDGKVVQQFESRAVPKNTSWYWQGAEFKTKKANSKIQLYIKQTGVKKSNYLLTKSISVDVTPPPVVTPPVQPSTCDAIDYKDPAQGVQTYADEFNGTNLNKDEWRVRDNTFLNQDAAFISKDNVSVKDGALVIKGKYEPQDKWRSNPNSLYGEENRVRKYSTGYVDSIKNKTSESPDAASSKRFSQKYGYFEARMWVPSAQTMSQGIWPAFWLRADNKLGEIDVMESYGAPTIRSFDPSPSYEWNSWEDTSQVSTKNHFLGRPAVAPGQEIYKGWHNFGVNWSPSCLRYTLDGKTVGVARPIAGEVPYINGDTFDSPFHIRFNMQIGSKYWGWPDPSVTKNEFDFKVDWVRVYQKK